MNDYLLSCLVLSCLVLPYSLSFFPFFNFSSSFSSLLLLDFSFPLFSSPFFSLHLSSFSSSLLFFTPLFFSPSHLLSCLFPISFFFYLLLTLCLLSLTILTHTITQVFSSGGVWHKSCFTCGALCDVGCNRVLARDNFLQHCGVPFCKVSLPLCVCV